MFGKKRPPEPAVDPRSALAPFVVANPDPEVWVQLPLRFPTPDERNAAEWVHHHQAALRARHPEMSKDRANGPFFMARHDSKNMYAGHDAFWVLADPQAPNPTDYLAVLFDIRPGDAASIGDLERRLLARSDDQLVVHPSGYEETPAAPGRSVDICPGGLGAGRCVVRRDRHVTLLPGAQRMLDTETLARYRDPDHWVQAISVHWLFAGDGRDLAISVRTDDRGRLAWAIPHIHRLIDGISIPGKPPTTSDGDSWRAAEALVAEAIAAAGEQTIVDQ